MASYAQIIKGLQIFAAIEGEDKHNVEANHDVIYAGPDVRPGCRFEEEEELAKQGWKFDEGMGAWFYFV